MRHKWPRVSINQWPRTSNNIEKSKKTEINGEGREDLGLVNFSSVKSSFTRIMKWVTGYTVIGLCVVQQKVWTPEHSGVEKVMEGFMGEASSVCRGPGRGKQREKTQDAEWGGGKRTEDTARSRKGRRAKQNRLKAPSSSEQGSPIPMRGGVKADENKTSPGWTFTSLIKAEPGSLLCWGHRKDRKGAGHGL